MCNKIETVYVIIVLIVVFSEYNPLYRYNNIFGFSLRITILNLKKQDCSYQGEALNVPTAFWGLLSSNK